MKYNKFNIIETDTKLLLRFLKENNILRQYFRKITIRNIKSYEQWIRFLYENKIKYQQFYNCSKNDKLKDKIKTNYSLFHSLFFAIWDNEPFVLNDFKRPDIETRLMFYASHDGSAWSYLYSNFIDFKILYFDKLDIE